MSSRWVWGVVAVLVVFVLLYGYGYRQCTNTFRPGPIDPSASIPSYPTSSEPIRITPSQISVPSTGESLMIAGIYNDFDTVKSMTLDTPFCSGNGTFDIIAPDLIVEPGQFSSMRFFVRDGGSAMGKYVCSLAVLADGEKYVEEQFFIIVTDEEPTRSNIFTPLTRKACWLPHKAFGALT